jgi:hypothetical protein
VFGPETVAEVKAMACEPPAARDVPLSRWSSSELAVQAVSEGLVESLSASTVRRWLAGDAIKPWQYRSWIFPRDPDFAIKAARVLDLYQRVWEGAELGSDDYVISADEKSQLQALSRCHPSLPAGPGRPTRVEFEYERHGTLAYFGAYDVHHARLIGTIAPTTGIVWFSELVNLVMTTEPYASARRVFWVVDNGSSHNGRTSVARMAAAWPTATLVHLPVHASWLNQIEIVFSVIQRKVVKPRDFADVNALAARLIAFEAHYNAGASPFDWTFTRADLIELCRRIDAHQPTGSTARRQDGRQCPLRPLPPRPASVNASPLMPAPVGRNSAESTSDSAQGSLTSRVTSPTVRSSHCAGSATGDRPADGASPSTAPATTTTRTTSFPAVNSSAAPKKPSTAHAASTSTTPPPGHPHQHRRTNGHAH